MSRTAIHALRAALLTIGLATASQAVAAPTVTLALSGAADWNVKAQYALVVDLGVIDGDLSDLSLTMTSDSGQVLLASFAPGAGFSAGGCVPLASCTSTSASMAGASGGATVRFNLAWNHAGSLPAVGDDVTFTAHLTAVDAVTHASIDVDATPLNVPYGGAVDLRVAAAAANGHPQMGMTHRAGFPLGRVLQAFLYLDATNSSFVPSAPVNVDLSVPGAPADAPIFGVRMLAAGGAVVDVPAVDVRSVTGAPVLVPLQAANVGEVDVFVPCGSTPPSVHARVWSTMPITAGGATEIEVELPLAIGPADGLACAVDPPPLLTTQPSLFKVVRVIARLPRVEPPIADALAVVALDQPAALGGMITSLEPSTFGRSGLADQTLYACAFPDLAGEDVARDVVRARLADDCSVIATFVVPAGTTHLVLDYGDSYATTEPWGATAWLDRAFDLRYNDPACAAPEAFTMHPSVFESVDGSATASASVDIDVAAGQAVQVSPGASAFDTRLAPGVDGTLLLRTQAFSGALSDTRYRVHVPPGVIVTAVEAASPAFCAQTTPSFSATPSGDGGSDLVVELSAPDAPAYTIAACGACGALSGPGAVVVHYHFDPALPWNDGQVVGGQIALDGASGFASFAFAIVSNPPALRLDNEPFCASKVPEVPALRTSFTASGGGALTNVVLEVDVPHLGDAAGTTADVTLLAVDAPDGELTCSEDGSAWTSGPCDASTRKLRVSRASLPSGTTATVEMRFDVAVGGGSVIRESAVLYSDQLAPIALVDAVPAIVGRCPGSIAIDGWFDDDGDGVRDNEEEALSGFTVVLSDDTIPLELELRLPSDGRLTRRVPGGAWALELVPPVSYDNPLGFGFSTAPPAVLTLIDNATTDLPLGLTCNCPGNACLFPECTRGVCTAHEIDPECCGNGVIDDAAGESCDVGLTPADGALPLCRADCRCDALVAAALPDAGGCTSVCGDAIVTADEGCDDGNLSDGDGCSAACSVEVHFDCAVPATHECPPSWACVDPGACPAAGGWCDAFHFLDDGDGAICDLTPSETACADAATACGDTPGPACDARRELCALCAAIGKSVCTSQDYDGDGYFAPDDCDNTNAAVHPGATELCNGVDDDCEGGTDEDFDLGAACQAVAADICTSGELACDEAGATRCEVYPLVDQDPTCAGIHVVGGSACAGGDALGALALAAAGVVLLRRARVRDHRRVALRPTGRCCSSRPPRHPRLCRSLLP